MERARAAAIRGALEVLTRRGVARNVAFVTPRIGKMEKASDWLATAVSADTAVINSGNVTFATNSTFGTLNFNGGTILEFDREAELKAFREMMLIRRFEEKAGQLYGMGGRTLRERADQLLRRFGLADAADRTAKGYSGGMQRRLDIAMGLVHRPQVLPYLQVDLDLRDLRHFAPFDPYLH